MKSFYVDPQRWWNILGSTDRPHAASLVLRPKQSSGGPDSQHLHSDQWLYVSRGKGEAIVDGKRMDLKENILLLIEAGETHQIKNTGTQPLETINLYAAREPKAKTLKPAL